MMHRESGSYFHFLLRGWLISYYIVHQRPVISDSFREESACAKIISKNAKKILLKKLLLKWLI